MNHQLGHKEKVHLDQKDEGNHLYQMAATGSLCSPVL
jgi:hypothetical protein